MRIRDIGLVLVLAAVTILVTHIVIAEPPNLKKEYIFEQPPARSSHIVVLDIPARDIFIEVIPEGRVELRIFYTETGETIIEETLEDVARYTLRPDKSTYLSIEVILDRDERAALTILIHGLRRDLINASTVLLMAGALLYLGSTLVSRRYGLDWL